MAWQRGERIGRPNDFHATNSRLGSRYTYYLDEERGYIKQVPVRDDDMSPASYFTLIDDTPRARPRRRLKGVRYALATIAVMGLGLVLYPLYPAAQYQVEKQVATTINHTTALAAAPAEVSADNHVIIPKIGVDTAILEGSSLDVLNTADGVWHQTGLLQNGNFVLAGHRFKYLPPNTSTLYNLHDLTAGDIIIVDWQRTRYIYVVDQTTTVNASDTKILAQMGGPRLTIYTCTNSSETMRTVVFAHRQD